ncbi:MAG: chemotaxis protein CheD [Pseudomonadota bacterium]
MSAQGSIKMTVMQGEAKASGDERVIMSTVLGSCISTCLYDPIAQVGGMNHFLLPKPLDEAAEAKFDRSYGLFLMELLINDMLKQGAQKHRLKARVYGGANINANLGPIGSENAAFARKFLRDEGIEIVHEDLEGNRARRVEFRPADGRVRARHVANEASPPLTAPRDKPGGSDKAPVGSVELF